MPHVELVMDLQFGSTGKGQFVGWYITGKNMYGAVAAAWGPNAGHTFRTQDGARFVHTMLPIGALCDSVRHIFIGPGAIINVSALLQEISDASAYLGLRSWVQKELHIHEHALIVRGQDRELEKQFVRIGSTMKGTGAAAIQRILRDPENLNTAYALQDDEAAPLAQFIRSGEEYEGTLSKQNYILAEGAQGYSLSAYHGLYPYTTYRDVTPAQILADCGIPVQWLKHTIGTMRTLPIRVANRFEDRDGQRVQVGTSGPGYPDQKELTWEQVGQEPELTTVTKLPRRIFSFSEQQIKRALRQCQPDAVFLNFCNYVDGSEVDRIEQAVNSLNRDNGNGDSDVVRWKGYGPNYGDIR